jgi:hypothetical protein
MNNFDKDANPFDMKLYDSNGVDLGYSFNDWIGQTTSGKLNCIVENRFYKNTMVDEGAINPKTNFRQTITNCKYLLCVPSGFYGLESHFADNAFDGFVLHDIGKTLPILGKDFNYKFCSFHVIGNKDETTLFLALCESESADPSGKYHYLYLNESSLDETYGFAEIDSVAVDQLIVPPSDVFSKVEEVRELDTVNIVLTDYGFWDIEANSTNNVTQSYRGGKEYISKLVDSTDYQLHELNADISKLVTPTMTFSPSENKVVEYSDDGETYGIDRIWEK